MGKGSFVLKIVIILLALLLVAVIAVPEKIWTEEEVVTNQSRHNMESIYTAEQFFYQKAGRYTQNLDTLITVIQNDTTLQQKKHLVELTHKIYDVMENALEIPSVQSVLVISNSVGEIQSDITGNERFFQKYVDLDKGLNELYMNFTRFDSSAKFPVFCSLKSFVDTLGEMKNRINEYRLQNAAYHTLNNLDSIYTLLPRVEKDAFGNFWDNLNNKIKNFIADAEKTDIIKVTNIIDRLKRFNQKINSSIQIFLKANIQSDLAELSKQKSKMNDVYQSFISPEQFQITQRYGLLELSDVEATLLNLNQATFVGPDSKKRYIVAVNKGSITIESPNLLDDFATRNQQIVQSVKDNNLFNYFQSIEQTMDSTKKVMNEQIPLIRRYGSILLNIKEVITEMNDLNSIKFYDMVYNLKLLVDTVQTEKRISVLKPLFEKTLNQMDSLRARIRNKNAKDFEERLHYFGSKIQNLDSLMKSNEVPSRVRAQIQPIYPTYERVFSIMNDMKNSMNDELAKEINTMSDKLEKSLLQALNGEKEPVYVIFQKKHINHGYIKDNVKSWEEK